MTCDVPQLFRIFDFVNRVCLMALLWLLVLTVVGKRAPKLSTLSPLDEAAWQGVKVTDVMPGFRTKACSYLGEPVS